MTGIDRLPNRWVKHAPALGIFIFSRLDPVLVEALGKADYDYICIDMQHGLMTFDDVLAMLQALATSDVTPIVRVPSNDAAIIGRVLDAGALGVIIPMVNSPEEAARAVAACRYAPVGIRSFGPVRAGMVYGKEYAGNANARILCIPMIETAEAVEQVEAILAVPGIDAVYVGPTDLALTYGLPPALDNASPFSDALVAIVAAAKKAGVVAGIHANSALAEARASSGFGMITVANDMAIFNAGIAAELRTARSGTEREPVTATHSEGAY